MHNFSVLILVDGTKMDKIQSANLSCSGLFHLRAPRQAHNECCKPEVSLTTQCAFRTICFWYLLIFTKALAADCSVSLVWVYDSLGEHHESTVWSSPE